MVFTERNHIVKGIDPVADAFAGSVASDVVNLKNYGHVTFLVYKGVGTTGTSTITVEACSDTTPTTTEAIAFKYRAYTSGDTPGTLQTATASGFTTTAGSSQVYAIEVDAQDLAETGYNYVRLKATEVVDSPVVGAILAILSEPRYASGSLPTATT